MAIAAAAVTALVGAPLSHADYTPWFERAVGNATQVISVVGVAASTAKMDIWQRGGAGWQPVEAGVPAHIGSAGLTEKSRDGYPATPMGVFTLDYVFGTAPSPGGGLRYVQVGADHWWDGDPKSPTYNTMQFCKKAQCPFDTSESENLQIPQYVHSVVMGVNKQRIPGDGGGFFMHASDGGATAGCVSLDDGKLVEIIRWLKPGAVIAIAK
jgi:L,D-peptidoglycan transpeptidase YkuD (ErfK/YbiS/YcfS/YnhG family)